MTPNSLRIAPVLFLIIGFVLGVMLSPWIATVLIINTRTPVPAPHYTSSVTERGGNQSSVVTSQFNIPKIAKKESSLLTLFTTWPNWSWKKHVFNNTLHNWRLLFPLNVTTVLFTNNFTVAQSARDLNWTVLPITDSLPGEDGAPILPVMFEQAREAVESVMYGFVNGDILFDNSIVDTVKVILNSTLMTAQNSPPVMITGRRINVENINSFDALSWNSLRKRARTSGKLFMYMSEDYFITNRDYPWEQYPPIAVGQRAYDNWLVLRGNELVHNLVDGSHSVLAVHQDTKDRISTNELKPLYDYNVDLLRNLFGEINYSSGQTLCCQFETVQDTSGLTVLKRREAVPTICKVREFV